MQAMVKSNGWELFVEYLTGRLLQSHAGALNFELNDKYRMHLLSQEQAFLEALRWAYREAEVPHPFDENLTVLMGQFERKLRTPQPQVLQGKVEVSKDPPPRRLRRGAGSIA